MPRCGARSTEFEDFVAVRCLQSQHTSRIIAVRAVTYKFLRKKESCHDQHYSADVALERDSPPILASPIVGQSSRAQSRRQIGQGVAIPAHLQDATTFNIPLVRLIDYGRQLFTAKFTVQEGAGRPFPIPGSVRGSALRFIVYEFLAIATGSRSPRAATYDPSAMLSLRDAANL